MFDLGELNAQEFIGTDAKSARRVAQTINTKRILGAAYAGFACAGLEYFIANFN
jgi:hypothetical protein